MLIFVFGMLAARYLGKHGFGIFSYAASCAWLLIALSDLGTTTLMTREIARDRTQSRRLLPQVVGMRFGIGVILIAVAWGISYIAAPGPAAGRALRTMSWLMILAPPAAYLILFRAAERMQHYALTQFIHRATVLGALLAAMALNAGITGVILAQLLGQLAVIIAVYILITRYYEPVRVGFQFREWGALAMQAAPFMALSILWEIYSRIDQILIPYMDSVAGNGLYGVAMRAAFVFTVIPSAIGSAVYPYFSRRAVDSQEPLRNGARTLYRILGALGLGAAVFVGVPAREWIVLIFGAEFAPARPALVVLMISMPLVFLQTIHLSTLYANDRQGQVLRFTLASIGLDVVLDLILIPRMGFVGAAVATLATNVVYFAFTCTAALRVLGMAPPVKILLGPLVSAAAAGALLHFAQPWPFPLRVAAAVVVFALLLVLTGTARREDLALIRGALPGRTGDQSEPPAGQE